MTENLITQLSIFVNNEPGRLAYVTSVLNECKINMRAFSLAESTEFGILRTIVDDTDKAYECLTSKGIIVKKTDIIAIYLEDCPGALHNAASILAKADINIEYGYAFLSKGGAAFLIRVDKPEEAVKAIIDGGLRVLTAKDM